MKRLIIEPYKTLEKANFYTLRFEDRAIFETDEFISRFIHDLLYQKDFSGIVAWLQKIGNDMELSNDILDQKEEKSSYTNLHIQT